MPRPDQCIKDYNSYGESIFLSYDIIVRQQSQLNFLRDSGKAQAVTHRYCIISNIFPSVLILKMPQVNGHNKGMDSNVLDYRAAVDTLKEDQSKDGLSVEELVDSRENGGLTYNDFLMLPDYIGIGANHLLHNYNLLIELKDFLLQK